MLSQFTDNEFGVKVIAGSVEETTIGCIWMQAYGSSEINATNELSNIVNDAG